MVEQGSPEAFLLVGMILLGVGLVYLVVWFLTKVYEAVDETEYYRKSQLDACRNCTHWNIRRVRYNPDLRSIECPCIVSLKYTHPLDWCDAFDRWERATGVDRGKSITHIQGEDEQKGTA